MYRVDKTLHKLPAQDNAPPAYLTWLDPAILVTTDALIPNKCSSSCIEADNILLYDQLDKALSGGLLESVLQAHKDNKDGQAVISTILLQHGGNGKWERHTKN